MLPNWLLGKSKTKLQEILGGGGGGTDYTAGDGIDISDGVISFDPLTTPTIDPSKIDGLDDDLAALAPKTALSNHNILHNPWFTVNQRGFTSTTSSGGYVSDRWRIYAEGANFTITKNSDGSITIDNSQSDVNYLTVYQPRTQTYRDSLNGMTLTASVMLSDSTIIKGTKVVTAGQAAVFHEDDQIRLSLGADTSGFNIRVKAQTSLTIKAAKLEVGEISTLHLDPRPEYALELAKCQRYFQRYTYTDAYPYALGMAISATVIRFPFKLKSDMRTTPTLVTPPISDIVVTASTTSAGISPTALTSHKIENGAVCLEIEGTGYTAGSTYFLAVKTGSANVILDFSAEI